MCYMIDLNMESPVGLAEVPKLRCVPRRPNGKTIHLATVHRWATRGVGGVVLETVQCGGTKCTTAPAIQRFFERLTERRRPATTQARTRREERRAIAEAESILDRAGVGVDQRRSRAVVAA